MSNKEKKKELACLEYLLRVTDYKARNGQYDHALEHLQDAVRSIQELKLIADTESTDKEIDFILKRISGGVEMKKNLEKHIQNVEKRKDFNFRSALNTLKG